MPIFFSLRTVVFSAGAVLCLSSGRALAQEPLDSLDLETALSLAAQNNRLLDAARARVEEAQGALVTANLILSSNPELEFAAGPRIPSGPLLPRTTDVELGIEQRFPITGQRSHRIGEARRWWRRRKRGSATPSG